MAGPPDQAHARLTLVFSGTAVPTGAVTTLGLRAEDPPFTAGSLSFLVPLCTEVHKDMSTIECVLDHIELKRGPEEIGPTWTAPVGVAGSGTGGATPPNVATLVRKELENLSAKFSGRMYWPGPGEGSIDPSGKISSVLLGFMQPAMNVFYDGLVAQGFQPVVFTAPGVIAASTDVSAFRVQATVATQRRRLRR